MAKKLRGTRDGRRDANARSSCLRQYCQMCKKGDNEDLLLLCDGCDKGCHTYCHKPKITSIPEGDWYCPACISKVGHLCSGLSEFHPACFKEISLKYYSKVQQ